METKVQGRSVPWQISSSHKNVALILDQQTEKVSPQFHVQFDPNFTSVKNDACDSQWQFKAGFVKTTTQEFAAAKRKAQKLWHLQRELVQNQWHPPRGPPRGTNAQDWTH